ncbi:MAG: Gamma-glutamyltransferase [Proteobacteria bacterium]|nr:Gamma-glutamyltransferase [Pseudomonadota bacterium]
MTTTAMMDMHSDRAMVATGHPAAARAAVEVLAEGGSAVDAAIAADALLGLVEPMATGIGGDLLAMLVEPDGAAHTYNGTGRAPMALAVSMVEALPGRRISERHPLSTTVPGVVRGWRDLHDRYGRLPWARLFRPAIELARTGFAVAQIAAREWQLFQPVIAADPVSAALYRASQVPKAGERFVNLDLAAVLEAVAFDGPDAFYLGRPAQAAAEASRARGGVLAPDDFALHHGNFDRPLSAQFRGLTVLECPPNTHGLAVLEALERLEGRDLDRADPRTTLAMVEAMQAGMTRAAEVVADPAGNTVCTVVVDESGLAVTLMTSVFKRFGSGIGVPGCGFVLQNRASGFAQPGHINGPGPGKRAYHTVIPAAALKDGGFHAGFGVVGGAMQPQGHLQLLVRLAVWGEPLQAAIDAPRWRLEGGALAIENGTDPAISECLRSAGYAPPSSGELGGRSDFGGAQVVLRAADGSLRGGSDRRKDGMALGL